ncbi:MAG: hypothetical protein ABIF71_08800 [Planctomycetota bacterium]
MVELKLPAADPGFSKVAAGMREAGAAVVAAIRAWREGREAEAIDARARATLAMAEIGSLGETLEQETWLAQLRTAAMVLAGNTEVARLLKMAEEQFAALNRIRAEVLAAERTRVAVENEMAALERKLEMIEAQQNALDEQQDTANEQFDNAAEELEDAIDAAGDNGEDDENADGNAGNKQGDPDNPPAADAGKDGGF